ATTKENIRYLTGFSPVVKVLRPYGGRCYAIITPATGSAVYIVPSWWGAAQVLGVTCVGGDRVFYGGVFHEYDRQRTLQAEELALRTLIDVRNTMPTHAAAFAEILARLGVVDGRIGLDEDGIAASDVTALKDSVSDRISWASGSALLRSVRQVKTAQ